MTKTELLEIIKNGENSNVEFKRDTIENRALAKELVALANLFGGRVILGIADDGTISGLTRADQAAAPARIYKKLEEWVMQACRDKIRPEIIPSFELFRDVEPGKDVAVVQVDRGWTVHHVWHDNHRTYYIRVGSLSREASPEELERMFQQRGAFRLETRPVSGSKLEDLDLRRLRDYFVRIRQQFVPPEQPDATWWAAMEAKAKQEAGDSWAQWLAHAASTLQEEARAEWKSLLVNTETLSSDSNNTPATIAGLLLFGKNPNRFLPQAGIEAVAYPGVEKDYAARERASLRGPMTPLFGEQGLIEGGLVEQAVDFVRRHTAAETVLEDGVRRIERWAYPVDVIRETVVNALVHRDYLLSATDIELAIYSDHLEIISPGRLPNGITPERMKVGCRAARNQLLKDVMRDYGYLEHIGMGIPRKIVKGMLKHNGTEPDLIEAGESFTVRLWKDKHGRDGQT